MGIRYLTVLSTLLAALMLAALMPQAASAQPRPPDAYELLEFSSMAMSEVHAARFSGTVDIRATQGGSSFSVAMSVGGEYQAPDRMRITMDLGSLFGALAGPSGSGPIEMIMVGDTMWTRMGSQPWEPSRGSMSISPSSGANPQQSLEATTRIIPNAVVADVGQHWEIRGDLDLMTAMEEGMAMSSMMGMPSSGMPGMSSGMPGMSPSDMAMIEQTTTRFSTRINKSTYYLEQMQLNMDMPDPSGTGTANMTFEITFSDYNSPDIQIIEPM
jgi:hypothetical protein